MPPNTVAPSLSHPLPIPRNFQIPALSHFIPFSFPRFLYSRRYNSFNQLNKEFYRLMAASMFHFPASLNFSFVILDSQFVLLYDGLYKVYTIANFHTSSFSLDA